MEGFFLWVNAPAQTLVLREGVSRFLNARPIHRISSQWTSKVKEHLAGLSMTKRPGKGLSGLSAKMRSPPPERCENTRDGQA